MQCPARPEAGPRQGGQARSAGQGVTREWPDVLGRKKRRRKRRPEERSEDRSETRGLVPKARAPTDNVDFTNHKDKARTSKGTTNVM